MKKTYLSFILVCFLFLCSCSSDGKIILPFEADLEKHFTALEKKEDGSALSESDYIDTTADCVILENDRFFVGLNGDSGALWIFDRSEGLYYDMTGNSFTEKSSASPALYIFREGELFCEYCQGVFYDVVYEKQRPSLTAFYTGENTFRLIYIIGIGQLAFLNEYPLIITESTYAANELAASSHYRKSKGDDFASGFVSEYCTVSEYYYLISDSLPEPARNYGNLDASSARRELLMLGYDADKAVICMFVADITVAENGITVDISTNRQYKSKGVRTSRYKTDFFGGNVPFAEKTDSESEYISFAGSKF
ncbi:MAG: hypothetical protein IKX78_02375 [Clostridia bacterium]|nr:hypothetical protein [Clostridia bacterium]